MNDVRVEETETFLNHLRSSWGIILTLGVVAVLVKADGVRVQASRGSELWGTVAFHTIPISLIERLGPDPVAQL
jgi:uncharacterized membrane protein (UPF0136 family)